MATQLPIELLSKKKSALEKLKEDLLLCKDYPTVVSIKQVSEVQQASSSKNLWDTFENPEHASIQKEDIEVIQEEEDESDSRPFIIDACDFKTAPLLDIDKLNFCSYCFSSFECVHEELHHQTCPLQGCPRLPQDYWPAGWPKVLSLSYNCFQCAMADCQYKAETSMELVDHITTNHATNDIEAEEEISEDWIFHLEEGGLSKDCQDKKELHEKIVQKETIKIENYVTEDQQPDSITEPLHSGSGPKTLKFYKCGLCHSRTSDVKNIMQHYLHIHDTDKLFICEQCKFVSPYSGSLKKHFSKFHQPKDVPPQPIKVMREHHDESFMITKETFKLEVQGLHLETNEGDSILPDHNLANYNDFIQKGCLKWQVKCKLCDYCTNSVKNMRYHITTKHITMISETLINVTENMTTYRCTICESVQGTKALMTSHYISKHLSIKKMECILCEKTFLDLPNLTKHCGTELHADLYRRSLRCKKCLFVTMKKTRLNKHAEEHKVKYKCNECSFVTKKLTGLRSHVDSVHSFRTKKDNEGLYRCDYENCLFSTTIKNHMQHHMRLHQSVKPIPCDECGFLAASVLGYFHHKKSHERKVIKGKNVIKKEEPTCSKFDDCSL